MNYDRLLKPFGDKSIDFKIKRKHKRKTIEELVF